MKWDYKRILSKKILAVLLLVTSLAVLISINLVTPPEKPLIVPEPNPTFRQNKYFAPDTSLLPSQASAHLISKIETKSPVVFLTIDDGQIKDQCAIEFIKQRQWPVTLFLADKFIQDNYEYFRQLVHSGARVQNHTLTHQYLPKHEYIGQKNEICAASNKIEQVFGNRPTLLRPPGGHYDANTFISAYECYIRSVVMWSAKVDGGQVQFQKGNNLVPGDIVLMHFRPKIIEDLSAFEAEITRQGLYVARLEDWIRISQ